MASLRKAKKQAKKMGIKFKIPEAVQIKKTEGILRQQVKETNKRLRALDRKGFYDSFSSKKLFEALDSTKFLEKIGNKVIGLRIPRKVNITELTQLSKATRTFLNSASSTPYKTQNLIRRTKKSMYATLKIKDDEMTMKDIDLYYKILGDKDFDFYSDKELSSEVWALFEDSKEKKYNEDIFMKRLNEIIYISNDKDLVSQAKSLYEKYGKAKKK